ncbi:hypothetical protein E2I00_019801, partial [Balaenoptera physalus]
VTSPFRVAYIVLPNILRANHSTEERFLLLGFSDWPSLQPVLFALVLLGYLLTLTGSSALVQLAVLDPRLHTPMYYFLCHPALVDAGFTTSDRREPQESAVCLFCGSAIYTYVQPTHSYNQQRGKFISLFYTVITPALNPLIYTLRNKEVKGAARRVLGSLRRGQARQ